MVNLSVEELEKLAKLACIKFSEEEKAKFASELSDLLSHFQKIEQVDTTGLALKNVALIDELRNDEITSSLSQSEVLHNSPVNDSEMIIIKPIEGLS